jgi:hypothetical protein
MDIAYYFVRISLCYKMPASVLVGLLGFKNLAERFQSTRTAGPKFASIL